MSDLDSLKRNLSVIVNDFKSKRFKPSYNEIIKAENAVNKIFNDFESSLKGKTTLSYLLAYKYLSGEISTKSQEFDEDRIVFSIDEPISELNGESIIKDRAKFRDLIEHYYQRSRSQNIWHLTWYGLLIQYLKMDFENADDSTKANWEELRVFLNKTFMPMVEQLQTMKRPWMEVIEDNLNILTLNPYEKYIDDILANEMGRVESLAVNLGIPSKSWFWQKLTLAVTEECIKKEDHYFTSKIPVLIKLTSDQPVFRDDCLSKILCRYYSVDKKNSHQDLKKYVIDSSVWKNPKLKYLGMASKWNLVPSEVWKMVLNWVTEDNLKMFFAIIQTKDGVADDRLEFWSKYTESITWSKFVLGKKTLEMVKKNRIFSDLNSDGQAGFDFSSEKEFIAEFQAAPDNLDAFIIEIGDVYFVEFSVSPNAAYYYKKGQTPFDVNDKIFSPLTSGKGLKAGNKSISHHSGWQSKIASILISMGVISNKEFLLTTSNKNTVKNNFKITPRSTTKSSSSEIDQILSEAKRHHFRVEDMRSSGGRLWIVYPHESLGLAEKLKKNGFRYSDSKKAWYLEEY